MLDQWQQHSNASIAPSRSQWLLFSMLLLQTRCRDMATTTPALPILTSPFLQHFLVYVGRKLQHRLSPCEGSRGVDKWRLPLFPCHTDLYTTSKGMNVLRCRRAVKQSGDFPDFTITVLFTGFSLLRSPWEA